MLKGIDPLLGPDLLAMLRGMGHGDEIAIVDANFPAQAHSQRLIRADGVGAVRMLSSIVSVMPIDDFTSPAAWSMAMVGKEQDTPEIVRDFANVLREAGYSEEIAALARDGFYERARRCFAIVATGEMRLYGNIILTKGVVRHAD